MSDNEGNAGGGLSSSDWAFLIVVLVAIALWGYSSGNGPLGFLEPERNPTYVPRAPLSGYGPYNSYGGSYSGGSDYTELDPVPMCPDYPGLPTEC